MSNSLTWQQCGFVTGPSYLRGGPVINGAVPPGLHDRGCHLLSVEPAEGREEELGQPDHLLPLAGGHCRGEQAVTDLEEAGREGQGARELQFWGNVHHVSHVRCRMSRINKEKKKLQSGGACRLMVCYQQGLPRLVFNFLYIMFFLNWFLLFLPFECVFTLEFLYFLYLYLNLYFLAYYTFWTFCTYVLFRPFCNLLNFCTF